jgi:hypothetical protein
MFSGLHLKADARRSREKNRSHPAMDPLVADQAQMRGIVVAMTWGWRASGSSSARKSWNGTERMTGQLSRHSTSQQ